MGAEASWERHLWIGKETTYDTAVTPAIWLPHDSCDIRTNKEHYQGQTFTGVRQQRAPMQPSKIAYGGNIVFDLYGTHISSKSIAEWVLEWATSGDASITQDSFTIERHEPNSAAKRWRGCRLDGFTLGGSANGPVKLTIPVQAKTQVDAITAPTLVATTLHPDACMFHNVVFSVAGSPIAIRAFQLACTNGLKTRWVNSILPNSSDQNQRVYTLEFDIFKESAAYETLMAQTTTETNITGGIVLTMPHLGTGASDNNTAVTIAIDRMQFVNEEPSAPRDDRATQKLRYQILKPNTTDNDVDITYALTA